MSELKHPSSQWLRQENCCEFQAAQRIENPEPGSRYGPSSVEGFAELQLSRDPWAEAKTRTCENRGVAGGHCCCIISAGSLTLGHPRGVSQAASTDEPYSHIPPVFQRTYLQRDEETNKQIKMPYFISFIMPRAVRCPLILCATKKEKRLPIKS